jgi:hypothetical protein
MDPDSTKPFPKLLSLDHNFKWAVCDFLKVIFSINLIEFLVSVLVFTPPKHSAMAVWTSSLQHTGEVLAALLNKYKIGRFLKGTVSQNGFFLCLICTAGMVQC